MFASNVQVFPNMKGVLSGDLWKHIQCTELHAVLKTGRFVQLQDKITPQWKVTPYKCVTVTQKQNWPVHSWVTQRPLILRKEVGDANNANHPKTERSNLQRDNIINTYTRPVCST